MTDTYVKTSQFVERFLADLTGNEYFGFIISTFNYRIKLTEIAKYILGTVSGAVRQIGTDVAGAIVTTTNTQDMTNKNLIVPKIGGIKLLATVTGTFINFLDGVKSNVQTQIDAVVSDVSRLITDTAPIITFFGSLLATVTELNYCTGLTANVEARIPSSSDHLVRCFGLQFAASGTSKKITEAEVLEGIGLSADDFYIDVTSMHGTTTSVSDGTYTVLDDASPVAPNVGVSWKSTTTGLVTHLDYLIVEGLTNGAHYNIAFSFKTIQK